MSKRNTKSMNRRNNNYIRVQPDPLSETEKLAIQAVRGVAAIKRLINVEEKYFDQSVSAVPTTASPMLNILTGVGLGDDATTRDGRSILAQRMHLKGFAVIDPTIVTGTVVRVIIFSDKVTNNAMPIITDVLEPLAGAGLLVNAPYRHDTLNNRFVFHKDVTIVCCAVTACNAIQPFDVSFSYNRHIKFDGSSAGVTSAESGHLYCLVVSNATNGPTVAYTSRLTFTDN